MPKVATRYHVSMLVNQLNRQYFGRLAHFTCELSETHIDYSNHYLPIVKLFVKVNNGVILGVGNLFARNSLLLV